MLTVRLLGPIEVHHDDRPIDLGSPQQRAVVAHLALDVGRVVPVDRLIDRLWGETPPRTPLGTLQSYVSRLRRAIEPERSAGGAATVLVSEAPGYALRIPPEQVDVHRFRSLADDARRSAGGGLHAAAIDRFDAALALWRGPALAGVGPEDQILPIVTRLEEERRAVVEDRFDVLLGLGRHHEVIPDLQAAVADDPLRERLSVQLATALYRSSRQADALRTIAAVRERLLDELGLDPGPELRDLERRILDQDAGLLAHPRPTVIRATPTPPPAPASIGIVGRDAEWARLTASLTEASPLVLVEGEPGIGKSTLVEALVAHAAATGWTTAVSRCVEAGLAPSLWPCIEIVRQVLAVAPEGAASGNPVRSAVAEERSSVARLTPVELAGHFVELLDELADRSWLIVLDDLHWADRASLDLLALVADRVGSRAVRIVVTHRPPELVPGTPFVAALGDLARIAGPSRIRIAPLRPEEVASLVESLTGSAPTTEVTELVHRRAGGNPLFVSELARLAGERGLSDETVVPDAIRDVVRGRLARLPEGTLAELEVAAVLGERFDLRTAMAASTRDGDACLDALDPAIATRILVPDGDGYRFAHALVRDAVLADVTSLRRARLHGRAADAIVDVRGEGPDQVEPIAHHRLAAVAIADPVDAARAAVRASDVARWRGALDTADRFAQRALEVLAGIPRNPDVADVEVDALEALVGSHQRRDDRSDLAPLIDLVHDIATRSSSDAALALELFLTWGDIDGVPDLSELVEHTDRARELAARTDDRYATVVTRYMSGSLHFLFGELDRAAGELELAIRAAGTTSPDEHPQHVPLVLVTTVAGLIAAVRGEIDEARTHAHVRTPAWLLRRGEVDDTATTALAFNSALVEAVLGEAERVRSVLDGVVRTDVGGFIAHQAATCDLLEAWATVRLGAHDALARAFECLEAVDASGERVLGPFLHSLVADACLVVGDDRATTLLEHARRDADARRERWWSAETLRLTAAADLRFEDGTRAAALLDEAEALARRQGAGLLLPRIAASRTAPVA